MDELQSLTQLDAEAISPQEGAGRGRKYFSSIIKPLQIEKDNGILPYVVAVADPEVAGRTGGSQYVSEEGRDGRDRRYRRARAGAGAGTETEERNAEERECGPHHGGPGSRHMGAGQDRHLFSGATEKMIVSRIEELSQLESPVLRELARRLGKQFNLQTPGTRRSPKLGKEGVPHPYSRFVIGSRWREIQGSNSWNGLLDPIDPVLRAEIVRYGEFAEACYDSFDADKESKYCGSCKHTTEELLDQVGLENRGYEVTDYLYATADLTFFPNFFTNSVSKDSWSKSSNWMGFVAVCTSPQEIARLGRRDILVAWRGTVTKFEWIKDIQDFLCPVGFDPRHENAEVRVEKGFLSVYSSVNEKSRYNKTSARQQVLGAVKRLVEKHKHEGNLSITVTGHSLGSALAMLCAYDIAQSRMNLLQAPTPSVPKKWGFQTFGLRIPSEINLNSQTTEDQNPGFDSEHAKRDYVADEDEDGEGGLRRVSGGSARERDGNSINSRFRSDRIPVTVFSFGGPRVGNLQFKKHVEELGVAILRVVNKHDLVTKVPGAVGIAFQAVLPIVPLPSSYRHVGEVIRIDHLISPFLKEKTSPKCSHTLEGYLHVLDGFHGTGMRFHPTLRDFALVNKRCNFLKKKYFIPCHWWQDENKGLRRDKDGHWIMPKRDSEIFPPTPSPHPDVQMLNESSGRPKGSFWRNVFLASEGSNLNSDSTRRSLLSCT